MIYLKSNSNFTDVYHEVVKKCQEVEALMSQNSFQPGVPIGDSMRYYIVYTWRESYWVKLSRTCCLPELFRDILHRGKPEQIRDRSRQEKLRERGSDRKSELYRTKLEYKFIE